MKKLFTLLMLTGILSFGYSNYTLAQDEATDESAMESMDDTTAMEEAAVEDVVEQVEEVAAPMEPEM